MGEHVMFDGFAVPPPPRPQRAPDPDPIPFDTLAALPLFRVQGLEVTIKALAIASATNITTLARMKALGKPVGDSMDDATPAGRTTQAIALLAELCARYRNTTGNDGLEMAHHTIARVFGDHLARVVITPLRERQWDHAIEVLLNGPDELPTPTITPEERRAACMALAEHGLSLPVYAGVGAALDAYAEAWRGGVPAVTESALGHLHAALALSAAAGVSKDEMQITLDAWSQGTGGPTFIVGDERE
jgi:hypothetical protein